MLTNVQLPDRLKPLLQFGEDDTLREEPDGWRDYVTELSLTHDDIRALLELLGHWPSVLADDPRGEEPAESSAVAVGCPDPCLARARTNESR
jgi:hypothetical protein